MSHEGGVAGTGFPRLFAALRPYRLVWIAFACCVSACAAVEPKPPFAWDARYASPGTSLTIVELDRSSAGSVTDVHYEVRARGFPDNAPGTLWTKYGTRFIETAAHLEADGLVASDSGLTEFALSGYVLGQPFDVAFESGSQRAHAKVYPHPNTAMGTGGSRATVEVASEDGFLMVVIFEGFAPGETIRVVSEYEEEHVELVVTCSARGDAEVPILFGWPDRGTARITATGAGGEVTVQYDVGRDALVPR
jgi:hypothetical protein